ncbi:hypothetical protein DM01DRAFT_1338155 [Hesseltinella vesiculosa]|uniref:Nucleoplasmin-like domain-containing protein n=1 Tax=Hesseltinella vesiculosa TaxID=101127 RepID=A0A1X2GAZ4_9FUNG|nr:hypothetical protein DM01DRAFT_1338155 [Hesseltinella vesiculosa]
MSSSLWCLTLQPSQRHTILCDSLLHITQATLAPTHDQPARSTLKVKSRGEEFALCTLTRGKVESQSLNMYFSPEDQACELVVTGSNSIELLGQLHVIDEDDDEDDEDFVLDEDEDMDEFGTLQFRDPSDNQFLGGFELHHFGLGSPPPFMNDHINLREQEETPEDKALHDNIVQGLLNSMINSGNVEQIEIAKAIASKTTKPARR